MPWIEPTRALLTGHPEVTVGHRLTADPVLGGLSEAACVLVLALILPSWVLNGLGLSFPICEQMGMIVTTADSCEVNTVI